MRTAIYLLIVKITNVIFVKVFFVFLACHRKKISFLTDPQGSIVGPVRLKCLNVVYVGNISKEEKKSALNVLEDSKNLRRIMAAVVENKFLRYNLFSGYKFISKM